MKTAPSHLPMKGKPVMSTFMTYVFNADAHKGSIVEVDFKVKGKQIEYRYKELRKKH